MRTLRPWLVGSVAALVLLVGPAARAQLLRISPGPLAKAHAHLEGFSNCTKCHQRGAGVPDFKCLDCHDHANLKRRIAAGKGFHASALVRGKPCISCHSDHKGRGFDIFGWKKVGGKSKFNHDLTGFALRGKHAVTNCEKCHTQKRPRTGTNVYLGLSQACQACHRDRHDTRRAEFKRCERCHGFDNFKPPRVDMRFKHNTETNYQLIGKHAQVACVKCHQGAKFKPMAHGKCTDCHQNPHKNLFATRQCTKCHDERRPWKQSIFDHSTTRFPLTGTHRRVSCYKCHVNEKFTLPQRNCKDCHADVHKGRFAAFQCETCHNTVKFQQFTFSHNTRTRFVLQGKHETAKCRDCHRGNNPAQFERFPVKVTTECRGCHRHVNAHGGQFKDRRCLDCHDAVKTIAIRDFSGRVIKQKSGQGGVRVGGPDAWKKFHGEGSTFPLTKGGHFKVRNECTKCHKFDVRGVQTFKGTPKTCHACHAKDDIHKGTLGNACESCHSIPGLWKPVQKFDHNKTRFPLRGKHAQVQCEACHPNKVYKPTPLTCDGCHGSDPEPLPAGPPVGGAGPSTPAGPRVVPEDDGAPVKRRPRKRRRRGRRGALVLPPARAFATGVPAPTDEAWRSLAERVFVAVASETVREGDAEVTRPGTGTEEVTRPGTGSGEVTRPGTGSGEVTRPGTGSEEMTPPGTGSESAGLFGRFAWERLFAEALPLRTDAIRFPRPGLVADLTPPRARPIGPARRTRPGRAKSFEPHEGVLGKQCDRCHVETGWKDLRKFNHDTLTAYPLTGKHKVVKCNDKGCHPDTRHFKPRPKECIGCHADPHKGLYGTKCEVCHTTDSFKNVKAFHDTGAFILQGVHDQQPCSRCHGDFSRKLAGLGVLCGTCHRHDDIHHNAFGNRCSDCHSQWAWAPARFRHSEVGCNLVGVHRTLPCRDCHRGGNFGGLNDQCVSCHLRDYYATGTHFVRGAPRSLDCANCHKPTSWAVGIRMENTGSGRNSVCR